MKKQTTKAEKFSTNTQVNAILQPIDTISLTIHYGGTPNVDYIEAVRVNPPIREKMFSSRQSNIYLDVFKPGNMSMEVFSGILKKRLAAYGFSDVVIDSAGSYRLKNGATRVIFESFFDSVEFGTNVLPLSARSKASSKNKA